MNAAPAGVLAFKILPDGRMLAVQPLTFDRARLTIGRGIDTYDRGY